MIWNHLTCDCFQFLFLILKDHVVQKRETDVSNAENIYNRYEATFKSEVRKHNSFFWRYLISSYGEINKQ